ncbi:hypothetical protein [Streptacidiphilus sp. PAMC 29251]
MSTTSGRRLGVDDRDDPEGDTGPYATRDTFHALLFPIAEYIALQPSPNCMRAAARRIATAALQTGDNLAEQAKEASR